MTTKLLSNFRAPAILVAILAVTGAAAACSSEQQNAVAQGCADDKEYFQSEVWTKVMSQSCVNCHNVDGAAKATRMILSRDPAERSANFDAVAKIAHDGDLLVAKPTGKAGSHGGGVLFDPTSTEATILATFVDRQKGNCSATTSASATLDQRQIRRLTRDEYGNTIADLLGIQDTYSANLPADTVADGFDNQADALQIGTLFVDKARTNAEAIAKAIDLGRITACQPAAGQEAACAETSIRAFGERAWRRPVSDAEVTRYRGVYDVVAAVEGFEAGIRAVVATMLQSPNFLFRTELGDRGDDGWNKLTGFEIASELSYLLWKSMPDDTLFAAARSGALAKPEGVVEQANRMIADDKARRSMGRFVAQWLDLDRLPQAVKDEKTYPGFDEALRADLRNETIAFFDSVARRDDGSFEELLTANYTFPVGRTAAYYGIQPGADGRAATQPGRVGILTHASVLAVEATPSSASPVRRGKLVRERFFCQSMPPPPPGLVAQLPPVDPSLPNRGRFTQHSADQACASCHRMMDPIGFGFEGFDGSGKIVEGADVSGEILGTESSNGTFQGVVELESKLAASADVRDCFTRQWIRFAYGIKESDASRALASDVAHRFGSDGTKIRSLLTALVQADQIFRRRSDADEQTPSFSADAGAPSTTDPTTPAPVTKDAGGTSPDLDVIVDSTDQNPGYQKNVTLTNHGTTGIDWSVKLPKSGEIYNFWNADWTDVGDGWLFVGKDYNKHLDPGQTATFGFQAK